jgi:tryptophan-rich sensory protein
MTAAAPRKFESTLRRDRAALLERSDEFPKADFLHHPADAARAMLAKATVPPAVTRAVSASKRLAEDAKRSVEGLIGSKAAAAQTRGRIVRAPGLLTAPQAAVCAIAAVLAMQAINFAGMHSNLQWAYAYMPALLQNLLQPRAAWYNVLGAAKARLGNIVSNEMWLRSLAKPAWAASCAVHRVAWFGVELAIGLAMFRLLTSPRAKAAPKSAKIAAGFMLFACAMRSAVWGFLVLGLRSLPLGVFHYATYVALLAAAAFKARKMDKVASRALMAANAWVAYTCAQFISMLVMNRA